jgi:hypothetical protein
MTPNCLIISSCFFLDSRLLRIPDWPVLLSYWHRYSYNISLYNQYWRDAMPGTQDDADLFVCQVLFYYLLSRNYSFNWDKEILYIYLACLHQTISFYSRQLAVGKRLL